MASNWLAHFLLSHHLEAIHLISLSLCTVVQLWHMSKAGLYLYADVSGLYMCLYMCTVVSGLYMCLYLYTVVSGLYMCLYMCTVLSGLYMCLYMCTVMSGVSWCQTVLLQRPARQYVNLFVQQCSWVQMSTSQSSKVQLSAMQHGQKSCKLSREQVPIAPKFPDKKNMLFLCFLLNKKCVNLISKKYNCLSKVTTKYALNTSNLPKYNDTLVNSYTVMQVSRKFGSSLVIFDWNPSFPSKDIFLIWKPFRQTIEYVKYVKNQFAFS